MGTMAPSGNGLGQGLEAGADEGKLHPERARSQEGKEVGAGVTWRGRHLEWTRANGR